MQTSYRGYIIETEQPLAYAPEYTVRWASLRGAWRYVRSQAEAQEEIGEHIALREACDRCLFQDIQTAIQDAAIGDTVREFGWGYGDHPATVALIKPGAWIVLERDHLFTLYNCLAEAVACGGPCAEALIQALTPPRLMHIYDEY